MSLTIDSAYDISQKEFEKELSRYSSLYHNKEGKISDELYDNFLDIYSERFGKEYSPVGAEVTTKKVKLPYWMGSLDKIKDSQGDKLKRWKDKYRSNYIVTEKLDGISALYISSANVLYTRGDGKEGTDISWLIPHLKLPSLSRERLVVRGEIIVTKKVFSSFSSSFANARNMVSGIVNSKSSYKDESLSILSLDFVTYEIIEPINLSPSQQLKKLSDCGFKTVKYFSLDNLTVCVLSEYLERMKNQSLYNLDGIVIYSDRYYPRTEGKNPGNIFAYKSQGETAVTKVISIEWNVSKHSVLKPRIKIEPVSLSGVTINYTTGFNAKYISDNKIGPGSILRVTRSGDVIPHIVEVITSTSPSLPEKSWVWNESGIDITSTETDDSSVNLKKLTFFFSTIGVKTLGEKTINKLVEGGYDTIDKIIRIKEKDIANKMPGIGIKTASNIVSGISSSLTNIDLAKLMAATQIFGFGVGEKKCKLITDEYPDILDRYINDPKDTLKKIENIKGFSEESAKSFIDNIPLFIRFLDRNKNYILVKEDTNTDISKGESDQVLKNKKIVFSGFRNKELEKKITDRGGKITSAVSSVTDILIVKDKKESSKKILDATSYEIPIFTIEEFNNEYNF